MCIDFSGTPVYTSSGKWPLANQPPFVVLPLSNLCLFTPSIASCCLWHASLSE